MDCCSLPSFFLRIVPQPKRWEMTAISSSLYSKWVIKSENYCHVDLSILDANGENFVRKYFHESIPFDLIGRDEFISRSRMKNVSNKLLFMDTLTILCRIEESDHDTEGCDLLRCQSSQNSQPTSRSWRSEDIPVRQRVCWLLIFRWRKWTAATWSRGLCRRTNLIAADKFDVKEVFENLLRMKLIVDNAIGLLTF